MNARRSRSFSRGLAKNLRRSMAMYLLAACTLLSFCCTEPTPTARAAAGVICISPVAPPAPRADAFRLDSLNATAARASQSRRFSSA
ncbi:hypothetical protein D3C85_1537170 [compost metagenome]